jgi:type III secretion system chaperone SycN
MSLLDSTLAEMADSLELPAFAFNNKGVAALTLGATDLVSIEKRETGVLLSVARPLPPHRQGLAEKALRLCGREGSLPFPARAGLTKDNRLVFTVWFGERAFTLTEALRCITALRQAQSKIAEM